MAEAGPVSINLTNPEGKTTYLVVGSVFEKGMHYIEIDSNQLCNGVYIYQLSTNNFTDIKKMIISK